MSEILDLIERLGKAVGGSPRFDAEIMVALDPSKRRLPSGGRDSHFPQSFQDNYYWENDRGLECARFAFPITSSLDATLALVEKTLPGRDWAVHGHKRDVATHRHAWASVRELPMREVSGVLYEANGATPALALCLALLKALTQGETNV